MNELFNNYQKLQNILAKDSQNFSKNFFNFVLYFVVEIFVNF